MIYDLYQSHLFHLFFSSRSESREYSQQPRHLSDFDSLAEKRIGLTTEGHFVRSRRREINVLCRGRFAALKLQNRTFVDSHEQLMYET